MLVYQNKGVLAGCAPLVKRVGIILCNIISRCASDIDTDKDSGPGFRRNLTANRKHSSIHVTLSYVYDLSLRLFLKRNPDCVLSRPSNRYDSLPTELNINVPFISRCVVNE